MDRLPSSSNKNFPDPYGFLPDMMEHMPFCDPVDVALLKCLEAMVLSLLYILMCDVKIS